MNKIFKISLLFLSLVVLGLGPIVSAQVGGANVQTNLPTNISGNQATLNGTLSIPYITSSNYVYFQWGTDSNYGNQTNQQYLNNYGSFSQVISGLNPNTIYHFRAVAQGSFGTIYGQDMTFSTLNGSGYYGSGSLLVSKKVINITSRNLNWSPYASASPNNILCFAITLQGQNQDVHNVVVREFLPTNLIYRGNLTVNTNTNYGGDITSGVNIGTVYANQPTVVSYQVQVADTSSFSYGTTTIYSNALVTSTESGTQTALATIAVNRSSVAGASTISTGLTNNFFTESFFLPLFIIIAGLWLYFSGNIYKFADWLKRKV